MTEQTTKLKILEAYTRDVGRGAARIDYDTMDKLGISTGAIVEVKGKNSGVFKVLPLYPSDEDKGIIRIDGIGRQNISMAIGDTSEIRPVKNSHAEKIIVKPLESIPPIDERYLADALESIPVTVGTHILVPYFGGRLSFEVLETVPDCAVVITQRTIFKIEDNKTNPEFYKLEKQLKEKIKQLKAEYFEKLKTLVDTDQIETVTAFAKEYKKKEQVLLDTIDTLNQIAYSNQQTQSENGQL